MAPGPFAVTQANLPQTIERVAISWSPNQASCFLSLFSQGSLLATIQVQADDTLEDRQLRLGLAALLNRPEISLAELRAMLPVNETMSWEDAVVVDLGAIELRGKGSGHSFWMSTPNPAGFGTPTPEQTSKAHAHLTAIRNLVWPKPQN